ncbi:MAG: hypothetical protein ACRCTB_00870 [Vibrio sp.]
MIFLGIPLWGWIAGGAAAGVTTAVVVDQVGDTVEQAGNAVEQTGNAALKLAALALVAAGVYVVVIKDKGAP